MFPGEFTQSRRLPAAAIVLALLAAGFLLARYLDPLPASLWLAAAAFLCSLAAAARGHICTTTFAAAAILFSAGWFTLRIHQPPPSALDQQLAGAAAPTLITVEGVVLETPRQRQPLRTPLTPTFGGRELTSFTFRAASLHDDAGQSHPASGTLRVRIGGSLEPPRAGERLLLTGRFEPLPEPLNPGERDQRLWRRQEGIVGSLRLIASEPIEPREPPHARAQLHAWLLHTRALMADRARAIIEGDADPTPARALLAALILGEEDPRLRDVRGAFQRLGLLHALSISGFHLATMAMVALLLLRAAGDLGWLEPLLVSLLIAAYLAILPFHAPVWRAGLMVTGLLLANALGRRYDPLAILSWIAIALLLYRPMDLWSIGFQLSFGLVAALIALGDFTHQRLWGIQLRGVIRPRRNPVLQWTTSAFKQLITANLLCWAIAAPIVMFHAGLLSPFSVIAGVLIVPIISILLIVGYTALLIGILVPPVAPLVSAAAHNLSGFTARTTQWMDQLPGASLTMPPVSLLWTLAALALILYWLIRGHTRSFLAWTLTAVLCGWLAAEAAIAGRLPRDQLLRVDALAVGDGTCMLIRGRDGAFLWDCGSLQGRVGELLIPRGLRSLGVWRIDTLIISHPNLDHYNGVLDLIQPLGIRHVILGEEHQRQATLRPGGPEAYLLHELAERKIQITTIAAGNTLSIGNLQLSTLSPPPGSLWRHDNDASLVLAITCGRCPSGCALCIEKAGAAQNSGPNPKSEIPNPQFPIPLLLTGDIQQTAMEHLTRTYPRLRARIMEAPHHGSPSEAAAAFLHRTKPIAILQSTGPQRAGTPLSGPWRGDPNWRCTAVDGASWAAILRDGSVKTGSLR